MSPVGNTLKKASSLKSTTPGRTRRANTPRIVPSEQTLSEGFHFKKGTPKRITLEFLSRYGKWIEADPYIDYFKTDFHKEVSAQLTPGKSLRHLRDAHGWSQSQLGAKLGDTTPIRASRISDWENDFRAISKPIAKKLSALFKISTDTFL